MRTVGNRVHGVVPSLVPNLPNLCFEVGKRGALPIGLVPNLPNLPNVAPCMRARTRVRASMCAQELSNTGWEGWEGWEEQAVERLSGSHPVFVGWEGWEQGWENFEEQTWN